MAEAAVAAADEVMMLRQRRRLHITPYSAIVCSLAE